MKNKKEVVSQLNEARKIIDVCIDLLSKYKKSKAKTSPASFGSKKVKIAQPSKLNFSLNERNFIRTYAKSLSGPKKFTLILSYLTKGKVGEDVKLEVIRSKWNKMTAKNLMGYSFNLKYPTEAKTGNWVDSKKPGTYHLRNEWMGIFS